MSLFNKDKSVIGRTLVLHSKKDDGTQPYGNAGRPQAFGIVKVAKPGTDETNTAKGPIPTEKTLCVFQDKGHVLMDTSGMKFTGKAKFEASISSLPAGSGKGEGVDYIFRLHDWWQDENDYGPQQSFSGTNFPRLAPDTTGVATAEGEFDCPACATDVLPSLVGRTLVLHQCSSDGTCNTPAAWGLCGIVSEQATFTAPDASFDASEYQEGGFDDDDGGASDASEEGGSGYKNLMGALIALCVILALICICIGIMYTKCPHRLGITQTPPVGSRPLKRYASEAKNVMLPPPPPNRL